MNFIQRLMYGRYGGDHLTFCLLAGYLGCYLLYVMTGFYPLYLLGLAVILWSVYRMFSRNIEKRRAENTKFLTIASPLIRWVKLRRAIYRDKEHRYFKCPNCGQQLRVPRGRGKVTVNCRSCGVAFEEKT